ncbi:Uu.00g007350.m01.CDS01 [Anthostomella pinea]|uniref:Uu.00g007350.m01.CDS01 n=1 Tax=Anthostomella pinea TaxID=933095 RepID=A0AAI8VWZ9_9PEZI|nr:Uu.00g007350.m01.CDS01 [Anthostomella pinea]
MGSSFDRRMSAGNPPADLDSRHQSEARADDETSFTMDPWLIAVIVTGIVIVMTLLAFMVIYYIRSRRWKRSIREADPISHHQQHTHKRKMSSADRQRAEELERDMMIRKSLASRSSSSFSTLSTHSSRLSAFSEYPLVEVSEEPETVNLRDDWKEWEAQIQRQMGTASHQASGLHEHPAFAPQLSVPRPSRMPSPVRGVIQPR